MAEFVFPLGKDLKATMDFVQKMRRALQRGRSVTLPSGKLFLHAKGIYSNNGVAMQMTRRLFMFCSLTPCRTNFGKFGCCRVFCS